MHSYHLIAYVRTYVRTAVCMQDFYLPEEVLLRKSIPRPLVSSFGQFLFCVFWIESAKIRNERTSEVKRVGNGKTWKRGCLESIGLVQRNYEHVKKKCKQGEECGCHHGGG